MGLQLKGENHTDNNRVDGNYNSWDELQDERNPWDVSTQPKTSLDFEEPKVVYNTAMAQVQAKQKESNPVIGAFIKIVVGLVVCGLVILVGRQIVSVVMPKGIDITEQLGHDAQTLQSELGESFINNPAWSANVYEYSKSDPSFEGSEDIGVVYMEGRQIGIHIPTKTYTIFNIRVGDGEAHMYKNTTYPFDNSTSILSTMSDKATVYIYYNQERNDCIFILINNVTNRIESMTYYNDYKKVSETLTSL